MTRLTITTAASVLALAAAAPVLAQQDQAQTQDQTQQQDGAGEGVQVLSAWSYDPLYAEGWSVESMFDQTEVVGADGEIIGDVENVVFATDGRVLAIIAQVGGFWDIGDTHVSVPWDEVELGDDIGQVGVPVTEETVGDYDVFGDDWGNGQTLTQADTDTTQAVDDDLLAGPQVFKATDLIGDYAYLSDGMRYGYVADLVVQGDRIGAIVTDAGAYGSRGGYYAYPYAYRSDMVTGPRYAMPYGAAEIETLGSFDYDRLQSRAVPQQ